MIVSGVYRYDVVVIEKDENEAKKLQEGHGGWTPRMASVGFTFPCIAARARLLSLSTSSYWQAFSPRRLSDITLKAVFPSLLRSLLFIAASVFQRLCPLSQSARIHPHHVSCPQSLLVPNFTFSSTASQSHHQVTHPRSTYRFDTAMRTANY